jgi:hypothetical protein
MITISPTSRQPARAAWTRERLLLERTIALGSSLDASSYDTYTSALNSYLTFCKLHGFDAAPTEDTLSFYVVFMSYHIKPQSVDSYLSGISHQLEPYFPEVRRNRKSRLVSLTLKGCMRLRNSPALRKAPLLPSDISTVLTSLHASSTHDDILFAAMLATGFHALLRLAEMSVHDNPAKRNWRKITMRHTVTFPEPSSFSFTLPSHKADPFFQGNTIVVRHIITDSELDPKPVFQRYLRSRDSEFPLNPELWLTYSGTVPTRTWFVKRLRAFFHDGLISGQSMRAGGATCLATTGALPSLIQAAGRWSSEAFKVYIRKNPFLLHAILQAQRAPANQLHS